MSELSKRIAELSPEKRALFVQRLSSIISSEEAQNRDEQATTTGSVPLTQNARWFFGLNLPAPHHWNLASLSTVQQDLDPTLVRQVLQHLLVYHDALRLRFKSIEHDWLSFIAPPDTVVPFTWIDLSEKNESEQRHNIEETATKLQASLNLEEGPLFKVALFNLGPQGPNRLLFIVHHLLADLYSLDILREDFSNAYQQLSQGKSIQQPLRTTSFKRWAERLAKYSQSGDLQQELDYWLTLPWAEIAPLPLDYPAQLHEFPLSSSTRRISIQLSSAETRALMQKRGVGTNSTHNLLLTAVVMAVGQWLDSDVIGVTIVHHGRDIDCDGIDLSRTVG